MDKKTCLQIVALIVAVTALAMLVFYLHEFDGLDEYNNGTCLHCGGRYVYQQAVGRRYFTSYIYICDSCGKIIETGRYMGK